MHFAPFSDHAPICGFQKRNLKQTDSSIRVFNGCEDLQETHLDADCSTSKLVPPLHEEWSFRLTPSVPCPLELATKVASALLRMVNLAGRGVENRITRGVVVWKIGGVECRKSHAQRRNSRKNQDQEKKGLLAPSNLRRKRVVDSKDP